MAKVKSVNRKTTTPTAHLGTLAPTDLVEIIVEPDGDIISDELSISESKIKFSTAVEPIAAEIESLGGKVTGEAWINRALKAKVPVENVDKVGNIEHVASLDSPETLESPIVHHSVDAKEASEKEAALLAEEAENKRVEDAARSALTDIDTVTF